jgi:hypothetical protein
MCPSGFANLGMDVCWSWGRAKSSGGSSGLPGLFLRPEGSASRVQRGSKTERSPSHSNVVACARNLQQKTCRTQHWPIFGSEVRRLVHQAEGDTMLQIHSHARHARNCVTLCLHSHMSFPLRQHTALTAKECRTGPCASTPGCAPGTC